MQIPEVSTIKVDPRPTKPHYVVGARLDTGEGVFDVRVNIHTDMDVIYDTYKFFSSESLEQLRGIGDAPLAWRQFIESVVHQDDLVYMRETLNLGVGQMNMVANNILMFLASIGLNQNEDDEEDGEKEGE